ncbi:hypothetical protein [Kitasatospora cinereorecta]|uniref:Uncharacterized protein n=1 Tax=Kitasatospora cinereorecta TaxID=285560 RepID=A0ABW0VQP7_9ACTN
MTEHPVGPPGVADQATPAGLLKSVVAQASFVAALMFYAGVLYDGAYYGYFHLSPIGIGFTFPELVIQSLRLLALPLLILLSATLVVLQVPDLLRRLPRPAQRIARGSLDAVARRHVLVMLSGVLLLLAWRPLQLRGWGWIAPTTIAAGLMLGQTKAANGGRRPKGMLRHAVPVFAAGLFLLWAVALIAALMGRSDAEADARTVEDRTAVVVFSTKSLKLTPHRSLHEQCLGAEVDTLYHCRYEGLRLLVTRGGRYDLLPLDWQHDYDPVYVLQESADLRVELLPGTR